MGSVINGQWVEDDSGLICDGGFQREPSNLNGEIPIEIIEALSVEPQRFHLIASLSCPWSHRTLIMRRFKQLTYSVPVKIASGKRTQGYPVNGNDIWRLPGTDNDITFVHEIYTISDSTYTGRASVPLLWDSRMSRVVSNDSMEIMKAFDRVSGLRPSGDLTLYPNQLRPEIDKHSDRIFSKLANGVYRVGLARSQRHYDDAIEDVFEMLDILEAQLSHGRMMLGRHLTLVDVVLFAVLVRFDIVYNTHFRCTRRRLIDYSNLWAYARDLFSWEPFALDVNFAAIQDGYFLNDGDHNPYKIISTNPDVDWFAPHHRAEFGVPIVSLSTGNTSEYAPAPAKFRERESID